MRQSQLGSTAASMVFRIFPKPVNRGCYATRPNMFPLRRLYSTKSSQPLRVLFCGSDYFSSVSLRALHDEKLRDPTAISSIDVLCRPGKPSGRGMKIIREVPIKGVAQELGLTLHERDTFTGWTPPQPAGGPINLIIAVSFGLKVPGRVLGGVEYGGINVHPSLLPDFRGPAPLQHTLLAGDTHTGVTLQTLHPDKMDHGKILAQTPPIEIPKASQCTYEELLQLVTPRAAEILIQGIQKRLFISEPGQLYDPSIQNPVSTSLSSLRSDEPLRHAPKITSEDRHIDWTGWSVDHLLRRNRVIGRLWTTWHPTEKPKTRLIFNEVEEVSSTITQEILNRLARTATSRSVKTDVNNLIDYNELDGAFSLPLISADQMPIRIFCAKYGGGIVMSHPKGEMLLVREITVEGGKRKGAFRALTEWSGSARSEAPLTSS